MKCHTAPNTTPVEAQARGLSSLAGIFGEAASVAAYIARSHPRSTLFLWQEMSIFTPQRTSQPHDDPPSVASRRHGGIQCSGSVVLINAYTACRSPLCSEKLSISNLLSVK